MKPRLLILSLVIALNASAAPPAKAPLEDFLGEVSGKTNKAREEVREDALEALRREGKITGEQLERIGRGKSELEPGFQSQLVDLLKGSEWFKTRTGLAAVRDEAIQKNAGDAFNQLKADSPTAEGTYAAFKKDIERAIHEQLVAVGGTSHEAAYVKYAERAGVLALENALKVAPAEQVTLVTALHSSDTNAAPTSMNTVARFRVEITFLSGRKIGSFVDFELMGQAAIVKTEDSRPVAAPGPVADKPAPQGPPAVDVPTLVDAAYSRFKAEIDTGVEDDVMADANISNAGKAKFQRAMVQYAETATKTALGDALTSKPGEAVSMLTAHYASYYRHAAPMSMNTVVRFKVEVGLSGGGKYSYYVDIDIMGRAEIVLRDAQ